MPFGRKLTFRQRKNHVMRGGHGSTGTARLTLNKWGDVVPGSSVVSETLDSEGRTQVLTGNIIPNGKNLRTLLNIRAEMLMKNTYG